MLRKHIFGLILLALPFVAHEAHAQRYDSAGNLNTNCQSGCVAGGGTVTANQGTAGSSGWPVIASPGSSTQGITPVVSTAAESNHVVKASAGAFYDAYVTTGATAGYLMIFNATTAPSDGAVTPIHCIEAPANTTVGYSVDGAPSENYATGIVVVFSSTGCFTKTASATAFFHARAN